MRVAKRMGVDTARSDETTKAGMVEGGDGEMNIQVFIVT